MGNAITPCCCFSITRERASAKRWRYAPVIFSWKGHGKCGCWAKAERNESAPFGPKPHQPYIGSFPQKAGRIPSSGIPVERR